MSKSKSRLTETVPTTETTDIIERLRAKLAPFRKIALGIAEGLHAASNLAITNIELRDVERLTVAMSYKQLDDIPDFYGICLVSKSIGAKDSKDNVSKDLWRAAVTYRMCSKTIYCLFEKINQVLKDDVDYNKLIWTRKIMKPQIVLCPCDGEENQLEKVVPILIHDFIWIVCKDQSRLALDFSGDQFEFQQWLWSTQDFNHHLWSDLLDPVVLNTQRMALALEEEEPRLPVLKSAVEKAIVGLEIEWAKIGVNWSNFHEQAFDDRERLLDGVVDEVKACIIADLSSNV